MGPRKAHDAPTKPSAGTGPDTVEAPERRGRSRPKPASDVVLHYAEEDDQEALEKVAVILLRLLDRIDKPVSQAFRAAEVAQHSPRVAVLLSYRSSSGRREAVRRGQLKRRGRWQLSSPVRAYADMKAALGGVGMVWEHGTDDA